MKKKSTFLKFLLFVGILLTINFVGRAQFAGPDQEVCANSTTLTATPGVPPGNWTLISGSGTIANPTSTTTSVTGLGLDNNIFRWTDQQGSDSVIITNNSVTADAGADMSVSTNFATLNANIPSAQGASGMWTNVNGGGTFANPTLYNTVVNYLKNGSNTLRWTLTKGICSASDDIVVTATYPVPDAGTDQIVCTDTTYLNATPIAGGYWENLSLTAVFLDDNTLFNARVFVLDPLYNTHEFVWHANGLTDTVAITNKEVIATNTTEVFPVCDFVSLSGNQTISGEYGFWLVNTTAVIQDPTNYLTTAFNLEPGINRFYWTIDNGFCSDIDSVDVPSNKIIADAGPDGESCDNTFNLTGSDPAPGMGMWTIVFGGG
ncbi:MAG: hypothetical protein L3J74_17565, partial [Bacteroidales bacterium]|nr:hypothetical protein [Bacteroidales bacterium]